MRDLQADLDLCNKATPGPWERNEKPSFGDWWVCSGGQHICLLPADKKGTYYGEMFRANSDFIAQAREGWPHAIERAIKAEAEVAKYKRALELVSQYIDKELDQCPVPLPNDCHDDCLDCMSQYFLEQALAELDKDGRKMSINEATNFDDLIRAGRYTDALRLFAKEYYGKMGHTRKRLCERVADENDKLQAELSLLRKVVDAARGVFLGEGEYLCSEFKNNIDRLRQALAELDKEES